MFSDSILLLLCSLVAMLITAALIPYWIHVCVKWNLFEKTDDRKKHKVNVPTMGGIAIFAGIIISFLSFRHESSEYNIGLLIGATVLLFFTGFFDDLIDLPPSRKLSFQGIAAIMIIVAGFRIDSLFGLMGISTLPLLASWLVTVFFIIAVTNAVNLIDGLDGLAGSLTLMASMIFGMLFLQAGNASLAMLSMCICGAVFGFLLYNFHPARVFMGDTGSLVLGFLLSIQAIALLQLYAAGTVEVQVLKPSLIMAVLFVPLYDVLRVSVIRILTGYSPFHPDRNHVHHMISGQGFGQRVTTLLIAAINLLYVMIALVFPGMDMNSFLILAVCLGMLMMNTLSMSWLAMMYSRLGGKLFDRTVKA